MNLFRETGLALTWAAQVLWAFCKIRLWTTLGLSISITGARLSGMLAFFLPLKVILLAGSDGVPRYFRFFIDPADKAGWIIGLSIATVGFYLLSLILDSVAKKLSEMGSLEVLQGANELAVASRQRDDARSYYRRFSGIAANLMLVGVAFSVLVWLHPHLALVIAGLVVAEYLLTWSVLRYGNSLSPGRLQRMIRTNLSGYLKIFTSINFLAGFFALLVPFLIGTGGNLLLAILAILLLRLGLNSISKTVTLTTDLWKGRKVIDPLVFRDRQSEKVERAVVRDLREVFKKSAREMSAREALEAAGLTVGNLESEWQDCAIGNVYTFRIKVTNDSGSVATFLQHQVFTQSRLHLLENEEYLFDLVPRSELLAATPYARFIQGPFYSQLVSYGVGEPCSANEWKEVLPRLIARMWSFEPPRQLLQAFSTSRPTLEGRLTIDYLKRLEIALDNNHLVSAYDDFLRKLERLKDILSRIPLYIYNPDMTRLNVALDEAGQPEVLTWGRWSIEPIGVELPAGLDEQQIEEALLEVSKARDLGDLSLDVDRVRLANECRELERSIAQAKYASALGCIQRILANPYLNDDECSTDDVPAKSHRGRD